MESSKRHKPNQILKSRMREIRTYGPVRVLSSTVALNKGRR